MPFIKLARGEMLIGDVAAKLNVSVSRVRRLYTSGRLPEVRRREGFRIFTAADVKQIKQAFIEGRRPVSK